MRKGVIEGFYGLPWSHEARLSMVDFLADIGLNSYIYAPKDDPYHNKKWRDPYPKKRAEEISDLARRSVDRGIDFIWAIHPGQNPFNFDSYDEELSKVLGKYDQLKSLGVTSFALCMDDVDKDMAYGKRLDHLRLIKDILSYLDGDKLLFVNPWYNEAWLDEKGRDYYELFKGVSGLETMWTGYDVVVPIKKSSQDFFKDLSGYKANIWFNWPVNDYKPSEVFMEVFEFYDSRDLNFDSFFINPMNEPELSKLAIYQISAYLKDPAAYDPMEAFKDGLSYLDKENLEALLKISDSFFGSLVYERQEDKKYREDMEIAGAYEAKDMGKVEKLLGEKLRAIDLYQKSYKNQALYEDLAPYIKSLDLLLRAVLKKLEKNSLEAQDFYDKSLSIEKAGLEGPIKVRTSKVLEGIYKDL